MTNHHYQSCMIGCTIEHEPDPLHVDARATFDARDDIYVWTARKDGTGRPVAYSGPHDDVEAMRRVREYPGPLDQIVVYLAPAEHEPYVRAAILAWSDR